VCAPSLELTDIIHITQVNGSNRLQLCTTDVSSSDTSNIATDCMCKSTGNTYLKIQINSDATVTNHD